MAIKLGWAVKGSDGAKPKGRYLERTRGRRRVPHETQGGPKCQMRTTFRSTSETSSRNNSIEQKSCAAENLVSKASWTRFPAAIMHSDQFPSPRNTSAQSQRTPSDRAGAMPGSGDERSTSESDESAGSSRARAAARDRCPKSSK